MPSVTHAKMHRALIGSINRACVQIPHILKRKGETLSTTASFCAPYNQVMVQPLHHRLRTSSMPKNCLQGRQRRQLV